MKKYFTKTFAVLLVIATVLMQTAFAATYYEVEVKLTGPTSVQTEEGGYKPGKAATVSGTSAHLSSTTSLKTALASAYGDMEERVETTFKNCDLSGVVAFCQKDYDEALKKYGNAVDADDVFMNKDTKISSLKLKTPYKVTFNYDAVGGVLAGQEVEYVVTVVVKQYSTGGSGGSGSSSDTTTTTEKNPDGTTGTVVTDKNGQVTEAEVIVSSEAAAEYEESGEAVTLPVEIPAAKTSEEAPAVQITLPKNADSVKVEIPVENVTPGCVAVIVNADGTEEIVATSVATENGVSLTLNGDATVKVIDNAKTFIDVPTTNVFYNEISAMSAREIMVGKTDNKFDLYNSVTLNQISNVAGRIIGAVDVSDYSGGIAWGQANGLKTGNVAATRGDVLKALYVAAGSPAVEDTSAANQFKDAADIPADMVAIVAWAAQNGILKGSTAGNADLHVNVTRGQACALAGRTMSLLA